MKASAAKILAATLVLALSSFAYPRPATAQDKRPDAKAALARLEGPERLRAALDLGRAPIKTPEIREQLTRMLADPEAPARHAAAFALGALGPFAREAQADLAACLSDSDKGVRWTAARALGRCGNTTVITALARARDQDRDPVVRAAAAEALRRLSQARPSESGPAKPDWREALEAANPNLRLKAIAELEAGELEEPGLPEALLPLTRDSNPDVRSRTLKLLARFAPKHSAIIPALIAALKDPDSAVYVEAAKALGRFGPKARTAVPALLPLLEKRDAIAASHVAEALGAIGDKSAATALLSKVESASDALAADAALALSELRAEAEAAVPAILRSLARDRKQVYRLLLIRALGNFGPAARQANDVLSRGLISEGEEISRECARSLAKVGLRDQDTRTVLQALRSDAPWLRYHARLVSSAGGAALQRALIDESKDRGHPFREDLFWALTLSKPPIKDALKPLLEALDKRESSKTRSHACLGLQSYGPRAKAALDTLIEVARADPDDWVRQRARSAIKAIRGE